MRGTAKSIGNKYVESGSSSRGEEAKYQHPVDPTQISEKDMAASKKYPFFELSPEQFEKLCIELYAASIDGSSAVLSEKPRWIDAVIGTVSTTGTKSVAVEVKHRMNFHLRDLDHFIERLSREAQKFDEYVFITSSPLLQKSQQILDSLAVNSLAKPIRLLGQEEIIGLLDRNPEIASRYFKAVRQRVKIRRLSEIVSLVAVAASLAGLTSSFFSYRDTTSTESTSFSSQIESVEESLSRLKSLEAGLRTLKDDLRSQSEESARVTKEYEEAMKLKALTSEQLEQVKLAINSQSRGEVFMNYFLGFLLGVAGSVLATIITDRWKQRRALAKPYA